MNSKNAVQVLKQQVKKYAQTKGLTFSQWETHYGNFRITITYAIHPGERPYSSVLLDTLKSVKVQSSQREGKTERCEAYRTLSTLFASAKRKWGE